MVPSGGEKAVLVEDETLEPTCRTQCYDILRPEPGLFRIKLFIVLFMGSIGSLFPYVAIYIKQLGLTPGEIGLVFGVRPIMAFIGAPVLGAIADKYHTRRAVLILACLAFTGTSLGIGHVPPPREVNSCPLEFGFNMSNMSDIHSPNLTLNASVADTAFVNKHVSVLTWVYEIGDVQRTLLLILVFSLVGEFFFSPIGSLTDTAVLDRIGPHALGKYARQRAWGAGGMAIFMLITGALLNITRRKIFVCGLQLDFTYYRLAFYVFSGTMVIATFIAATFRFTGRQEQSTTVQMTETPPEENKTEGSQPEYSVMAVLRLFLSVHYFTWLFSVFYMGMCNGVILGFLFWHLENKGASKLLMGVAGGLASFSECVFYFGAGWFVERVGTLPTIYISLLCYGVRFANYAFMVNPWMVLPSEVLQGFTFAMAWVAMVKHVSIAVPEVSLATIFGILHGVYWGLGIGSGYLLGGLLIGSVGAIVTFKIYMGASVVVTLVVMIAQKLSTKPVYAHFTTPKRPEVGPD